MENKKGKIALNDDLLDKVSGGDGLEPPSKINCFPDCPYGRVCVDGQPCPVTHEPDFDVTDRDI